MPPTRDNIIDIGTVLAIRQYDNGLRFELNEDALIELDQAQFFHVIGMLEIAKVRVLEVYGTAMSDE